MGFFTRLFGCKRQVDPGPIENDHDTRKPDETEKNDVVTTSPLRDKKLNRTESVEILEEPEEQHDGNTANDSITCKSGEKDVDGSPDRNSYSSSLEHEQTKDDGSCSNETQKDDDPIIDQEKNESVESVKEAPGANSEASNQPANGDRDSQTRISILSKLGTMEDDELHKYSSLTRNACKQGGEGDEESNDDVNEKEPELQQNYEEAGIVDLEGTSEMEERSALEIHSLANESKEANEYIPSKLPSHEHDGDYSQLTIAEETTETNDSKVITDISRVNDKPALHVESDDLLPVTPTPDCTYKADNVADDLEILDLEDYNGETDANNVKNDEIHHQAIGDAEKQVLREEQLNPTDAQHTSTEAGENNTSFHDQCTANINEPDDVNDLERPEIVDASLAVLHDSTCLELTNDDIDTAKCLTANEKLHQNEETDKTDSLQILEETKAPPTESYNTDDNQEEINKAHQEEDHCSLVDDSIDKSFDPNASQFASIIEHDVEAKVSEIIEQAYEAATISINASMDATSDNSDDDDDEGSELFIKSPMKINASGGVEQELNRNNEDEDDEDKLSPLVTDLIESSFDHPEEEEQAFPRKQTDEIASLEYIDVSCIDHDTTTTYTDLVDVTSLDHQDIPNNFQTSLREEFRSSMNGSYGNGGNHHLQLQRAQSVKVMGSERCSSTNDVSSSRPTSAPMQKVEDNYT